MTTGRLDDEARTAMAVVPKGGQTQSAVARLPGVTEGAVRRHRRRRESGATDGRSLPVSAAAAQAAAIAHWRDQQTDGRINLAALHDWLRREQGYGGSLKSAQRYWRLTFPALSWSLFPGHPTVEGRPRMDGSEMPQRETSERIAVDDDAPVGGVGGRSPSTLSTGGGAPVGRPLAPGQRWSVGGRAGGGAAADRGRAGGVGVARSRRAGLQARALTRAG
jgi:hypothetical protein